MSKEGKEWTRKRLGSCGQFRNCNMAEGAVAESHMRTQCGIRGLVSPAPPLYTLMTQKYLSLQGQRNPALLIMPMLCHSVDARSGVER